MCLAQFARPENQRVVGCRGGSRCVEVCCGFPYLNIKKGFLVSWLFGSLVFGFLVSWFEKTLMFSKDICDMLPNFNFMILIDIDPISKIFKIVLDGSSGLLGARLFQKCQFGGFPKC